MEIQMLNFIHTTYGLAPYPVAKENTLLSGLHTPSYYCENVDGHLILNDYNSLSGVVDYYKACKEHNKKVIIGCKFLDESGKAINLVAKNLIGYKTLLKLVSRSNDPDRYNKRPVLRMEDVDPSGLILILGGLYGQEFTAEEYKGFDVFTQSLPNRPSTDSNTLICCDLHYHKQEQLEDFKILLCSALRCKLRDVETRLVGNDFLYALDSYQRVTECPNEQRFLDLIEDYDILRDPALPEYKWTDGLSEQDYLVKLCREGYRKKNNGWDKEIYGDRFRTEIEVINKYKLNGYFLIVSDFIKWAKRNNILCGPARGSSCSSLVCYLLDITEVDPIKHKLIFSRFINSARFVSNHVNFSEAPYSSFYEKAEII